MVVEVSSLKYIMKKWGGRTSIEKSEKVTVSSSTPTRLLKNNPNRIHYMIVNIGDYSIFIGFTNQVAVDNGIELLAGGGTLIVNIEEDAELTFQEVWAIAETADTPVYIVAIQYAQGGG